MRLAYLAQLFALEQQVDHVLRRAKRVLGAVIYHRTLVLSVHDAQLGARLVQSSYNSPIISM